MKYYSAIERSKVLIHVATWMNFESTMLTERNQTKPYIA